MLESRTTTERFPSTVTLFPRGKFEVRSSQYAEVGMSCGLTHLNHLSLPRSPSPSPDSHPSATRRFTQRCASARVFDLFMFDRNFSTSVYCSLQARRAWGLLAWVALGWTPIQGTGILPSGRRVCSVGWCGNGSLYSSPKSIYSRQ